MKNSILIFLLLSLLFSSLGECKKDGGWKKKVSNFFKGKDEGLDTKSSIVKKNLCMGENITSKITKLEEAGVACSSELLDKKEKKCQEVCELDKIGLIHSGNFSLNVQASQKWVNETFPKEASQLINIRIGWCLDKLVKKNKTEPLKVDGKCKEASKFIECIKKDAIKKVCKIDGNVSTTPRSNDSSSMANNNRTEASTSSSSGVSEAGSSSPIRKKRDVTSALPLIPGMTVGDQKTPTPDVRLWTTTTYIPYPMSTAQPQNI